MRRCCCWQGNIEARVRKKSLSGLALIKVTILALRMVSCQMDPRWKTPEKSRLLWIFPHHFSIKKMASLVYL